jgi:hypothetical protein
MPTPIDLFCENERKRRGALGRPLPTRQTQSGPCPGYDVDLQNRRRLQCVNYALASAQCANCKQSDRRPLVGVILVCLKRRKDHLSLSRVCAMHGFAVVTKGVLRESLRVA